MSLLGVQTFYIYYTLVRFHHLCFCNLPLHVQVFHNCSKFSFVFVRCVIVFGQCLNQNVVHYFRLLFFGHYFPGLRYVLVVKSHIKVYRLYNEFNSTQVLPYHRLFRKFIYNYHIRCIAGESVHINGLTYTHKQAIRLAAWHRYTTFLLFLEWNIALFTQDGTLHQYSTFHMHDLTF